MRFCGRATDPDALTVIPMDTCHDMMVSKPKLLAELLLERRRRHA